MRPSPMQVVKEKFGGRAKLVEALVPTLHKERGDTSSEDVKKRLMGLSNAKLLRLYRVEQKIREQFGDREKLMGNVLDAYKKAGFAYDERVKTSLDAMSNAELLDVTRRKLPERPAKMTPEQKLARKRGRKARARALLKLGRA